MGKTKRIFGPVPSRRLGFSLGVDVIPFKTCALNCIYCQLGSTREKTIERKAYFTCGAILSELRRALRKGGEVDYVTFSGSGEPTLNLRLGGMIRGAKRITRIPVAVLTGGALLSDPKVREDLKRADLVLPSLDAGTEATFRRINRPHPALSLKSLVGGMADFTRNFPGRVWLEVMLVNGVNDSRAELRALARRIRKIGPEKVQLNTVVRPPAEKCALALKPAELNKVQAFLEGLLPGIKIEVVEPFSKKERGMKQRGLESRIIDYLKRRPATLTDLSSALGRPREDVVRLLRALMGAGRIREERSPQPRYFLFVK